MGQIVVTVSDISDIRAYECIMPDDVSVSRLVARLVELTHMPVVGPDNFPLNYGLVVKGGTLLDSECVLAELALPHDVWLRLVPEIIVTQDDGQADPDSESATQTREEDFDIRISEPMALLHDVDLGLPPDVRIDAPVHREIEQFAEEDRNRECGGLLLGSVSAEAGERVIHIAAAVPAEGAVGTKSSLKITLEAWEEILAVRDTKYDDLSVLGWFHTHAGWGVFMSDPDVFFHRHFFAHPNMVAYVLDPTSARDGFFYWHEGKISMCPSYALVGTTKEATGRRHPVKAGRARPDLRDGVIAALVVLALYLGFSRPPPVNQAAREIAKPPVSATQEAAPAQATARIVPEEIGSKDRIYAMRDGDNPWTICSRVYGDARLASALVKYNGLKSHTRLQIGQQIRLPPKEVLQKIARER